MCAAAHTVQESRRPPTTGRGSRIFAAPKKLARCDRAHGDGRHGLAGGGMQYVVRIAPSRSARGRAGRGTRSDLRLEASGRTSVRDEVVYSTVQPAGVRPKRRDRAAREFVSASQPVSENALHVPCDGSPLFRQAAATKADSPPCRPGGESSDCLLDHFAEGDRGDADDEPQVHGSLVRDRSRWYAARGFDREARLRGQRKSNGRGGGDDGGARPSGVWRAFLHRCRLARASQGAKGTRGARGMERGSISATDNRSSRPVTAPLPLTRDRTGQGVSASQFQRTSRADREDEGATS